MQILTREKETDDARKKSMRRAIQVVILLLLVSLIVVAIHPTSSQVAKKAHAAATWNPIWGDYFNGAAGTGVNTSNWRYDTGTGWGTGEIENMTNSTANVQQDGKGHLKITAIRDASGHWTSGRIESQRADFAAPAGGQLQVSASIQQPNISGAAAAGYWPAFWMLGAQFRADRNWPNDGEIDTMEDVNGLSSVFGTLHCGSNPGGPCHETTGISSGQRACAGCQNGLHTYSVIVDRSISPEEVRWYLDGNNYFSIHANQVPAATWSAAVDHGFYIIFDLAMGGGFPNAFGGGPTPATQSGASMIINNVQVSTLGGGGIPLVNNNHSGGGGNNGGGGGGGGNSGFTQSANSGGANQAQLSFQPNGWMAGYVIVHYTVTGGVQQNVYMNHNSSTSSWTSGVGGLNSGNIINYSFTYQKNGLQYDTGSYTWREP